jgi:hypothetical protein
MVVLRFLLLLLGSLHFIAVPLDNLAGTWRGRISCRSVGGSLEIVLARNGEQWSGSATLTSGPNTAQAVLRDARIAGDALSFAVTVDRADVRFSGTREGDGIRGTVRVLEGEHTLDEGTWAATRDARNAEIPSGERVSPEEKRAIVASLAQLLRRSYVDATKGEAMAAELERRLAHGDFDRFEEPLVLNDEIGRVLFATAGDKHLKLSWQHDPIPLDVPAASDRPESARERDELRRELRRENFGFRKLEVLSGNVGYLALSRFVRADLAGETAAAAMQFLGNCDALVIDLRECGGGDPALVAFLSSWLFDGRAVHVADMYRREDDLSVQWWTSAWVPGRRLESEPVCVLTAQRTFSAAEALAFHLQKLGRATVVGETTGGGAHPVRRYRVSEHVAVAMPTSRAMDPATKTDWEGAGVQPDVSVRAEDALEKAHLLLLERLLTRATPDRAKGLKELTESVRTRAATKH